jgi:UDP-glucose 4-epimerase
LITGAVGYIDQQLLIQLTIQQPNWTLIAADSRPQNRAGMKLNLISNDLQLHPAALAVD